MNGEETRVREQQRKQVELLVFFFTVDRVKGRMKRSSNLLYLYG